MHLFPEFATEMSLCTVLQSLVLGGNATVHIAKLVHVLTTKYNHENLPIELLRSFCMKCWLELMHVIDV